MADAEQRFGRQALHVVAGPAIWGAHLGAVYGWTALACARHLSDATLFGLGVVPFAIGAVTILAVAAAAAVLLAAVRGRRSADETRDFTDNLSALGSALALVAIVWSGLPAVLVTAPCG